MPRILKFDTNVGHDLLYYVIEKRSSPVLLAHLSRQAHKVSL